MKGNSVQKQTFIHGHLVYGEKRTIEQWERTVISVHIAGPSEYPQKKMKLDPYLTNTKINSR